MIIAIIAAFTLYFFYANKKQRKGEAVLEETVRTSLQWRNPLHGERLTNM